MKTLLIALCFMICPLLVFAQNPDLDEDWEKYKLTYNKSYGPEEDARRRLIWEDNVALVNEHNKKADEGLYKYRMRINKFSDMTEDEFIITHTGILAMNETEYMSANENIITTPENALFPPFLDWRIRGVVTGVKDQGECSSSWAFSSIAALESQHAMETGKLVSLSEQNLLDCVKNSYGCDGGFVPEAFKYIIDNDGVATEESYPYLGYVKERLCRYDPEYKGASMSTYAAVHPHGDESILQNAVANYGPVVVHMQAEEMEELKGYSSGIFSSESCMNKKLDHSVLLVGYGTQDGQDFWLIKNSWSTDWGVDGYLYLERNTNMCGIATIGLIPFI